MTLLRNAVLRPDAAARAMLPRLKFNGADNQERHGRAAIIFTEGAAFLVKRAAGAPWE